jgi:hypothetical protein
MKYFAEINNSDIVISVLNVSESLAPNEETGITWLKAQYGNSTNWAETFLDGSQRYNYAGIGFTWDSVNEAFIYPQPFPSWSLDSEFRWQAPLPYPDDGKKYRWDETALEWVETLI